MKCQSQVLKIRRVRFNGKSNKSNIAGCPLCLTGVKENVPLSLSRCEKVKIFPPKGFFISLLAQARESQMVEFGIYSEEGKLRPIGKHD